MMTSKSSRTEQLADARERLKVLQIKYQEATGNGMLEAAVGIREQIRDLKKLLKAMTDIEKAEVEKLEQARRKREREAIIEAHDDAQALVRKRTDAFAEVVDALKRAGFAHKEYLRLTDELYDGVAAVSSDPQFWHGVSQALGMSGFNELLFGLALQSFPTFGNLEPELEYAWYVRHFKDPKYDAVQTMRQAEPRLRNALKRVLPTGEAA